MDANGNIEADEPNITADRGFKENAVIFEKM